MPEESEDNERLAKESEDKKRLAVIEGIFRVANKKYACPVCRSSQTSFPALEEHLSRKISKEKNGPHAKLIEKDLLSSFHTNYENVVEWAGDSILRSQTDRCSAFEIGFVVTHGLPDASASPESRLPDASASPESRLPGASASIEMKLQNYLDIAKASGMKFVCPLCLEEGFQYFNTMDNLREHCQNVDQMHQDLMSGFEGTVLPAYRKAMNRSGDEMLHVECSPRGPKSYQRSFMIEKVLLGKKVGVFCILASYRPKLKKTTVY